MSRGRFRRPEDARTYTHYRAAFRHQAEQTLASLPAPDWATIFARSGELSEPADGRHPSRHPVRRGPVTALTSRGKRTGRLWAAIAGRGPVGVTAKAALLAAALGLGGIAGYRQYRLGQARNFVRSDTSEFVSELLSSSLFTASRQAQLPESSVSAWFSVQNAVSDLPVPSPPAAGEGGRRPVATGSQTAPSAGGAHDGSTAGGAGR